MSDFGRKKAVMTGASRGICRATAMAFAKTPALKWWCPVGRSELARRLSRITASADRAIAIAANISFDDCAALIQKTFNHFGSINILVCNASINRTMASLSNVLVDVANKTIQTNLLGNLTFCQSGCPYLKRAIHARFFYLLCGRSSGRSTN